MAGGEMAANEREMAVRVVSGQLVVGQCRLSQSSSASGG